MVVEDGLAVGFEDGFGGHCEGYEVCLLFDASQYVVFARLSYADRSAELVCANGSSTTSGPLGFLETIAWSQLTEHFAID